MSSRSPSSGIASRDTGRRDRSLAGAGYFGASLPADYGGKWMDVVTFGC